MRRTFVSLDGEILAEEEWEPSARGSAARCFYCDANTAWWGFIPDCPSSLDRRHDLVELVNLSRI